MVRPSVFVFCQQFEIAAIWVASVLLKLYRFAVIANVRNEDIIFADYGLPVCKKNRISSHLYIYRVVRPTRMGWAL